MLLQAVAPHTTHKTTKEAFEYATAKEIYRLQIDDDDYQYLPVLLAMQESPDPYSQPNSIQRELQVRGFSEEHQINAQRISFLGHNITNNTQFTTTMFGDAYPIIVIDSFKTDEVKLITCKELYDMLSSIARIRQTLHHWQTKLQWSTGPIGATCMINESIQSNMNTFLTDIATCPMYTPTSPMYTPNITIIQSHISHVHAWITISRVQSHISHVQSYISCVHAWIPIICR